MVYGVIAHDDNLALLLEMIDGPITACLGPPDLQQSMLNRYLPVKFEKQVKRLLVAWDSWQLGMILFNLLTRKNLHIIGKVTTQDNLNFTREKMKQCIHRQVLDKVDKIQSGILPILIGLLGVDYRKILTPELLLNELNKNVTFTGDDLLFGCDIMDEKDITINTRSGLEIQGHWVDCDVLRKSDKVARVVLEETVTVPPHSEVILPGYGINAKRLDTRCCTIEPVVEDDRKILVARCMIDPYQDTVPVRFVNLESFSVKMKKNY
ncbi:unnamed protein product [Mytilus coruscus]|uniref:Uncharacterized protein n=1 Tax=Mytilus coruscus TaxID=42192 RepID=A0A6J8EMP8_MYTCO|nr:unnamed protein product [Mytilus coruscus]